MTFREKILAKKFVVTSEVGPPKGIDVADMLANIELLKTRVDAINVTDLQSSVMRLGSLATSTLLKQRGIEPVLQMTCRDRNRLALQSDLLSAAVLGIENVLLLTGDYPTLGDHPEAKPVYDFDSVQLIQAARTLEQGTDIKGNPLKGAPHFFIGAVVNHATDPLEPEIIKMEKKVKAGAQFFQTQAVFDIELFKKFLKTVEHIKIPILAGIVVLKSAKMALYMNENVPGVYVPEHMIQELAVLPKEKLPEKSIEIAAGLIKELKPLCSGIHLMPLGWDRFVPAILDRAGIV